MFGKIGEMKKMYDKYKSLQKELKKIVVRAREGEFEDASGETGPQITVTITGEMKIDAIDILDDALMAPEKKSQLEQMLMRAVEKAQSKAQDVAQEKTKEILGFDPSDMGKMMGGGGIPGLS